MDQHIIDLYDRFTHGGINRRDFLDRLADSPAPPPRPRRCCRCCRTTMRRRRSWRRTTRGSSPNRGL